MKPQTITDICQLPVIEILFPKYLSSGTQDNRKQTTIFTRTIQFVCEHPITGRQSFYTDFCGDSTDSKKFTHWLGQTLDKVLIELKANIKENQKSCRTCGGCFKSRDILSEATITAMHLEQWDNELVGTNNG